MRPPSAGGAGDIISKRIALKKIAVVKKQAVRHFGPRRRDLARNFGQAAAGYGPVRAIVIGQKAGVQIAGGNQTQRKDGLCFGKGVFPGLETIHTGLRRIRATRAGRQTIEHGQSSHFVS